MTPEEKQSEKSRFVIDDSDENAIIFEPPTDEQDTDQEATPEESNEEVPDVRDE